jgi:hypothetical protein
VYLSAAVCGDVEEVRLCADFTLRLTSEWENYKSRFRVNLRGVYFCAIVVGLALELLLYQLVEVESPFFGGNLKKSEKK